MIKYNSAGQEVGRNLGHLAEDEIVTLIAMWKAGEKQATIADKLNRTEQAVGNACRRLARKGLIAPRSVTLPDAVKAQVKELWGAGVRRATIAERLGMSEVAVFSLLRRMHAKGEVEIASVPHEDMPPTRLPSAMSLNYDQRRHKGIKRGPDNPAKRTSHQAIVRALPLPPYVGQSGVVIAPWPADVEGKPLLGGIGEMPEPPMGAGLCSWITSPSDGSVGWRQTKWCCEKVEPGSHYCAEHRVRAAGPAPEVRTQAPINTTMATRFGW